VLPRCSTFFKHASAPHFNVTPVFEVPFDSPERMCGLPCDATSDVFAATSTIAYLATGAHPFRGDYWQDTAESIRNGERREAVLPPVVAQLIDAGLALEPSSRPTAAELAAAWKRLQ
jgi:hypothetical protein